MARPRAFDESDVLAKARDQFWAYGYAATSVQDLESATGLSRSSLYATFGDKRHLYVRVLQTYRGDSQTYLRDLVAFAKTFHDAVERLFCDAAVRICACPLRKGCLIANAPAELASVDDEVSAFVCDNRETFVTTLLPLAERDASGLPLKPAAACDFVFTLYSGLSLLGKSGASHEEVLAVAQAGVTSLRAENSATNRA